MSVFPDPPVADVELDDLFDLLASSEHDDPAARAARRRLVEIHLPMASRLASRYRSKGLANDDLVQVARMALVGAVDRFDPQRRTEFVPFAATTIHGELKKHFRDTAWALRVPRGLQERCYAVSAAISDDVARTGVEPTAAELADQLELSTEQVREALHAAAGYHAASLQSGSDERGHESDEASIEELVEARDTWREVSALIRRLPERERRIIYLRYFEEMTQSQSAACIGVSQMQVSRILSRSLDRLGEQAGEPQRKAG